MNHLARWVRTRRTHVLGISQAELAKRSGLSKRKIEDFESERQTQPYEWTLTQLARGLGVDLDRVKAAMRGDVEEELGTKAGGFLDDDPEWSGLRAVPLIETSGRFGRQPPKFMHIPVEVGVPSPMFASVVIDDSMSPQLLDGDIVVWAEDGEFYRDRPHWLRVSTDDGVENLVRQVLVRADGITLMPLNPRFSPLHVERRDVVRWGKIIYLSRPVG